MLIELLLGGLIFLFVLDYFHRKKYDDVFKKYNITGPKPLPFLGNALMLRGIDTEKIMTLSRKNRAKYGKMYRIWFLHLPRLVVGDVKFLEAIMSSQQLIKKSDFYDFIVPWLGTGLLLSNGKKWHTRRKIITPTFHFKILEQFVEVFDQQSTVMVKKLYAKSDGKTAFDIFPIICLQALDVIAETAMGVKVHAQENPEIEYVQALAYVARIMGERFITPSEQNEWLFRFISPKRYRETKRCIKVMHDFTNNVIAERRAALEKSIADGTYSPMDAADVDIGSKKRMALLDVLLQSSVAGNPLSNEDIREEVDTFMFEGHDTTTSAISFCLYLLGRHPIVQNKCIEEIHQVVGNDTNSPATYRQLQDLKYLECVIKESLRLYPAVPAIGRETTEDITVGGVTIPAHTNINLSIYMAHRDPDYFPNPDAFDPERFNAANSDKIHPFAFTAFSAGPRNCIGQKFAMLEMKSSISKILRHFEILPLGPDVRPMINLILRSVNGVHIGLKPRNK